MEGWYSYNPGGLEAGRKRKAAWLQDKRVTEWIAGTRSRSESSSSSGSSSSSEADGGGRRAYGGGGSSDAVAAGARLAAKARAGGEDVGEEGPLDPRPEPTGVEDPGIDYTAKPWAKFFEDQVKALGRDCVLPLLVDSKLGTELARQMAGEAAGKPSAEVTQAAKHAADAFTKLAAIPTPTDCVIYMGPVLPGHPRLPEAPGVGETYDMHTLRVGVLDAARVSPAADVFAFGLPPGADGIAALFAFTGDEGPDAEPFVMLQPRRWECVAITRERIPTVQQFYPSEASHGGAAVLRRKPEDETAGSGTDDDDGDEDDKDALRYAQFPSTIFKYAPA